MACPSQFAPLQEAVKQVLLSTCIVHWHSQTHCVVTAKTLRKPHENSRTFSKVAEFRRTLVVIRGQTAPGTYMAGVAFNALFSKWAIHYISKSVLVLNCLCALVIGSITLQCLSNLLPHFLVFFKHFQSILSFTNVC